MGPGIDPGVCAQDGLSIDVEYRKSIQDVVQLPPLPFTPAALLCKRNNLTATDHRGNSSRFLIIQRQLLPSSASPGRFSGGPKQYAGIQ